MSMDLEKRLNQILDRLVSDEFRKNIGLGHEIPFYVFDYPPERELQIREYIPSLLKQLARKRSDIAVQHINLFQLIIDYPKTRKLLHRAYKLQKEKGNTELLKALKAPLHASKIAKYFVEVVRPDKYDMIIMSGIGSAWPILRSHTLLNNLHPYMDNTPLVIFYPGKFDGQGLKLFSRIKDNNYYRAFRLVV